MPETKSQVESGQESSGSGREGGKLYVVGWLKRGPTGIIGTNAVDADETVASIAEVCVRVFVCAYVMCAYM